MQGGERRKSWLTKFCTIWERWRSQNCGQFATFGRKYISQNLSHAFGSGPKVHTNCANDTLSHEAASRARVGLHLENSDADTIVGACCSVPCDGMSIAQSARNQSCTVRRMRRAVGPGEPERVRGGTIPDSPSDAHFGSYVRITDLFREGTRTWSLPCTRPRRPRYHGTRCVKPITDRTVEHGWCHTQRSGRRKLDRVARLDEQRDADGILSHARYPDGAC